MKELFFQSGQTAQVGLCFSAGRHLLDTAAWMLLVYPQIPIFSAFCLHRVVWGCVKSMGLGIRHTRVQILALIIFSSKMLSSSFNLAKPQFPHLQDGDDSTCFAG